MAWALETNVGGLTWGSGYMMAPLADELFCFGHWNQFNHNVTDGGVFRRNNLGVWANVFATGRGPGRKWSVDGALYTIKEFFDVTRNRPYSGRYIYRSVNGAAWIQDFDIETVIAPPAAPGARPTFSSVNEGDDGYLYFVAKDLDANLTYFFRRNNAGVYAQAVAAYAAGILYWYVNDDLISHNGILYWAPPGGTAIQYWTGSAWAVVSDLSSELSSFDGGARLFIIYDNELYMKISRVGTRVYRLRSDNRWGMELSLPTPWGSRWTSLIEGDNGDLYLGVHDGAGTSRIFVRSARAWSLASELAAGPEFSAVTSFGGTLYAGVHPADAFWVRAPLSYPRAPEGIGAAARFGLLPQSMDVDGDGDRLYLGSYDGANNPIVNQVVLPLVSTAVGAVTFAPGAGNAINVKCPVTSDRVAISGNFGNNEQVETSEDGALTWTDIDRDAWGAETAQPLIVAPLTTDEVMVALAGAQDITETFDAGATAWAVNNAALGYSPGAMAKLVNGTEMIWGDDAANVIDYSPNRGVSTAVITGAFGGNVAAMEIT